MKRLSGVDASFLYSETPTAHMHTLKIAVLDAPAERGGALVDRFRAELARRIHLLPHFRHRMLVTPLGLHHPVWAPDPAFALDRHIRRRTVPSPGGPAQMDAVIAQIAGEPLPRDRPLWEIWLLDGLADDTIAFVAKLHHALADGGACASMLARVMAPIAADAPLEPPRRFGPGRLPSTAQLVTAALMEQPGRIAAFLPLLARTARSGIHIARSRRAGAAFPQPFSAAQTAFNRALGAERSFATVALPMRDLRAIRQALGISFNDVFHSEVSLALDDYLRASGRPAPAPLVASVPVGTGDAGRLSGNRLSNIIASLENNTPDPIARARAIQAGTAAAKAAHDTLGEGALGAWSEYTPPLLHTLAARLYSGLRVADRHRPAVNLVVSNVRGPDVPLTIGGCRLRRLYSVGPILEGIGLNITAWSYGPDLGVAALSHRHLPLPIHVLCAAMPGALSALLEATRQRSAPMARAMGG